MVDGIEISSNVCVQHPAYLFRHDTGIQCAKRIVGATPRPKTIGKTEKISFIYRIEYINRCFLNKLVFQGGYSQGTLPAVGFRYKYSAIRFCSVRSAFQSGRQLFEILFKLFAILSPCLAINSRRSLSLHGEISPSRGIDIINMVPERGKPTLAIPDRCLSYPFYRIWQVRYWNIISFCPVLCPELVLLEKIALGQTPSLHNLRRKESHLLLLGCFSGTYGSVRLPTFVHCCGAPLGFSARTLLPSS